MRSRAHHWLASSPSSPLTQCYWHRLRVHPGPALVPISRLIHSSPVSREEEAPRKGLEVRRVKTTTRYPYKSPRSLDKGTSTRSPRNDIAAAEQAIPEARGTFLTGEETAAIGTLLSKIIQLAVQAEPQQTQQPQSPSIAPRPTKTRKNKRSAHTPSPEKYSKPTATHPSPSPPLSPPTQEATAPVPKPAYSMAPRPQRTHFLSIPLVTPTSRPVLRQALADIEAQITAPDGMNLPPGVMRPVGSLHLTLGVFRFTNDEELNKASELLKSLDLREMLAEARRLVARRAGLVGQEGMKVGRAGEEDVVMPEGPVAGAPAESVQAEITPVEAEVAPVETEATPVETEATPVDTETAPVATETTPTQAETTPTQAETTPVKTEATPVETEATPVGTEAPPVDTEATPVDTETAPVATETTPTQPEATPTQAESAQANPDTPYEPLTITLRGLRSMKSPHTPTSLLYGPPHDPTSLLHTFCNLVLGPFRTAGLLTDDRHLLLHATMVNTLYLRFRFKQTRQWPAGPGVTIDKNKNRFYFDARELIDRFEDRVWLEGLPVEKLAICKMGARKVVVEGVEDEAYEVVAEREV